MAGADHDPDADPQAVVTDRTQASEPSRLPVLCHRLAEAGGHMVVLTPHKRPEIRAEWGWQLEREWLIDRVRLRFYRSSLIESSMQSD